MKIYYDFGKTYLKKEKEIRKQIISDLNKRYGNKSVCVCTSPYDGELCFIEKIKFFLNNATCYINYKDLNHKTYSSDFALKWEFLHTDYENYISNINKKFKGKEISLRCSKLRKNISKEHGVYYSEGFICDRQFILKNIKIKEFYRWNDDTFNYKIVLVDNKNNIYSHFFGNKIKIVIRMIDPILDPYGEENWGEFKNIIKKK